MQMGGGQRYDNMIPQELRIVAQRKNTGFSKDDKKMLEFFVDSSFFLPYILDVD